MSLLGLLKKVPIDLGQGNLRFTTQGKVIAMALVGEGSNKTALDVGCREGYQSQWLKSKGYQVTSIDIEKNYDQCQLVNVDEGLPFADASFDLIWCSEVIEHLHYPEKAKNEFWRVLKPGGQVIITTPNSYFWLMRLLNFFGLTPQKLQNPDHKQFFSFKDIKALFPEADFYGFFPYIFIKRKITKGIGILSPTFVISLSKKKY